MFLWEKQKLVNEVKSIILAAFPRNLHDDVDAVINACRPYLFGNDDALLYNARTHKHNFQLSIDEQVAVPYRFWSEDFSNEFELPPLQQTILHCIFSRNTDGYIREKHIKALLTDEIPEWVLPYILKLSDEYVIEILEDIYSGLKDKDNSDINNIHPKGACLCLSQRCIWYLRLSVYSR